MKKIVLLTVSMLFCSLLLSAGDWNPNVTQGIVSPAPLLPWQFNGTGMCSFNLGNTGNDPVPFPNVTGLNMTVLITLSDGVPSTTNPLDALGGTYLSKFTWSYTGGSTNSFYGVQNAEIPGYPNVGTITIQYKVTVNSPSGTPANGFQVNIQPPLVSGGANITDDDQVSAFTYTQAKDYGDAPISYGSADHEYNVSAPSGVFLGTSIDYETVYQASATANGDDIHGIDDEDGVTFPILVKGTTAVISVVTTGGPGFLNAWIDWNVDGDFGDAGEKVISDDFIIGTNSKNYSISVPSYAIITAPTFARFRYAPLASYPPTFGSSGTAPDGEVEDYMIQINSSAYPTITKTDGANNFLPGTNNVYTVVVSNVGGSGTITGALVNDPFPSGITSYSWSAVGAGGATPASTGTTAGPIVNHSITLPVGGTMTYTITAPVPCGFTGNLVNTASVTVSGSTNYATDIDIQNEWKGGGTTDWNTASNWTIGIPNCTTIGAVIPTGKTPYPVINTTGNFTANLKIQSGATLTINPGKDLTVCGCTKISGADALYLKSDGTSGNASFVTKQPYPIDWDNNTGSAKVELYLTPCNNAGGGLKDCWHYVSSPVTNIRIGEVFQGEYAQFYNELTGAWGGYITDGNTPLYPEQGVIISNPTVTLYTFQGQLNDGTVTRELTRTVNKGFGWNLVGNPYPSEIDLSLTLPWSSNIDQVVYYWDKSAGNYLAYPATSGFGTGSQYIPSMQGFFVHVNSGISGTLQFTDANRTTTGNVNFYKDLPADLIWLTVQGSTSLKDQIIVYFRPDVSSDFDAEVDAYKLGGAKEAPQLNAITTDGVKATIYGLPFAGINTVVPLEFKVNSDGTGTYSITASKFESFQAGTRITLEDKKTNTDQLLTENPVYTFSYTKGEDPARFLLHFYNPYYGINDKEKSQQLIIYSYENNIYVKDLTGKDLKGQISVYNIVGQKVAQKALTGGTLNKFRMNLDEGYYIVEVLNDEKAYHGKVYLMRV